MFAWQDYGVKPDIMTCAKALGCGVPVGAFVLGRKGGGILSGARRSRHHLRRQSFVCAAVSKVFDLFEEKKLVDHVKALTPYLEQKLDELVTSHDCLAARRGKGFIAGPGGDRQTGGPGGEKSTGQWSHRHVCRGRCDPAGAAACH